MFHEHKDLGDRRSLRSLEGPQPNPNGFPLGNRFRRIEPVPVIAVATTQASVAIIKDHAGPKHRDRPYQSGRSKHWIKVKNRKHQAFARVQEAHRR